jgi:hypothetical protein
LLEFRSSGELLEYPDHQYLELLAPGRKKITRIPRRRAHRGLESS